MEYTINDKRFKDEEPLEVCRVCGSREVHTREYNIPTMKCIEHYRELLKKTTEALSKAVDNVVDGQS